MSARGPRRRRRHHAQRRRGDLFSLSRCGAAAPPASPTYDYGAPPVARVQQIRGVVRVQAELLALGPHALSLAPRLCSALGPPVRELLLEEGALLLLRVPLSLAVGVADEHGWWHACCCRFHGRGAFRGCPFDAGARVNGGSVDSRKRPVSTRRVRRAASTRYAQRLLDEL